jgi:hypothetical protein
MHDDYESTVDDLRKRRKWREQVEYCKVVARQLEQSCANLGDGDLRLLSGVYCDLSIAFTVLDKPRSATIAMAKSIKTLARANPDPVDVPFGYGMLARCCASEDDTAGERRALIRSITCLTSRREAHFIAASLEALAAVTDSIRTASYEIQRISDEIGLQSRWVSRSRSAKDNQG